MAWACTEPATGLKEVSDCVRYKQMEGTMELAKGRPKVEHVCKETNCFQRNDLRTTTVQWGHMRLAVEQESLPAAISAEPPWGLHNTV